MSKVFKASFILIVLLGLAACQQAEPTFPASIAVLEEHPVLEIPLIGPAADAQAEISGMAWCGDQLILLPQYPDRFSGNGEEIVFSIPKSQIEAYLAGESSELIQPEQIPFDSAGFSDLIHGFEGFEAIAFSGDMFFVTVEARQLEGMAGYLIKGTVEGDCSRLTLEPDTYVEIPLQADLGNMSDETILLYEDQVRTIYEANGLNVNPGPLSHVFDLSLLPIGVIPMPNIEYRITDATVVDEDGVFWAINYFYPGDTKLKPAEDQIVMDYGIGKTHQVAEQVERLLAIKFGGEGIQLAGLPPIYLELEGETKNWEGIVRYSDGFLLVTDEYPTTILAFIGGLLD